MKYVTTAAMVLALAAAGAAEAQQPQGQTGQVHGQGGGQGAHGGGQVGGRGGAQGGHGGQGGGQAVQHFNAGSAGQRAPSGNARNPYAGGQTHLGGQGGQTHFTGQGGAGQFGGQGAAPRESGFGFQNHALRDRDQGRGWFNGGAFPHAFQAERHFQVAPYVYPHGWYARTWSYGSYLPLGWYAPDYYLDWADYGLPAPPIGCEWVRVGSDALLVDIWTGEVLSVYSGIFD
jgi:Ni/Co efflux regulator RcnB